MNWVDELSRINEMNKIYGLQPPAPVQGVDDFAKFSQDVYGVIIPSEFLEFWKIQNGLEYDGNAFYGVDAELFQNINQFYMATNNAIIASNLIWHGVKEHARYTFLGDGNIDWFVYDTESGRYMVLDKPSAEIVETFKSFEEFFSAILTRWAN